MRKIYFLGAGSTHSLGLPTSNDLGKKLKYSKAVDRAFLNDFFDEELNIQDVLNLLDYNIINHNTLRKNNRLYTPADLEVIKNKVKVFIMNEINDAVKGKDENSYQWLVDFYYRLAYKALEDKANNLNKDLTSDDFVYTNYSIINLNWDIYSVLPILKAHQQINDLNHFHCNKNHPFQLRIYAGLASYLTARNNTNLWQPYNGFMAKKINNPALKSKRKFVIARTYFPHGLTCYRECPICKKITIPTLTNGFTIKQFKNDEETCAYCGNRLKEEDVSIELQSNYKRLNPYYTQDIYDMLLTLSEAEEITFVGYSLPIDDLEFRNYFRTSIKKEVKIKVVLYDDIYKNNSFYRIDDYPDLSPSNNETAKRFIAVFGKNVLFNFAGSPKCFEYNDL